MEEYEATNPASHAELRTTVINEKETFEALFLTHRSMVCVANECAHAIIGLDGAHMKHRHYNHQQLVLEGRDGAGKNVLLATALVPIENEHWYTQFLRFCKASGFAALMSRVDLVVVSDRDKGLLPAIASELPNALHRFCTRHIVGNIKAAKDIPSSGLGPKECLIWAAQQALTRADYEKAIGALKARNERAAAYLDAIDHDSWTHYATVKRGVSLFGWRCFNFVESENSRQAELRKLDPLHFADGILEFWQRQIHKLRSVALKWEGIINPVALTEYEQGLAFHTAYRVLPFPGIRKHAYVKSPSTEEQTRYLVA